MIEIDGIKFKPIRKHNNIIPNYYVSKCGKIWNDKSKKYITPYKNYRNNKTVDKKPKCMDFSMTTEGQPYWEQGYKYKPKKNSKHLIEFRMKLHLAVKDSWQPYRDYLNTLTKEELIELAQENMLIDHKDDDPMNNHLSNLQYSTPLKNSNYRKLWE